MSDGSQSRPILSVCIPAFSSGSWLVARVRAWLAAAESAAVEIVVSDNASSDGTAEALAAIGDRRLRLVRQTSNVGPFENQLRALEAARGRYVMQLTDKDELLPEGLPAALAALEPLDVACGEFVLNSAGGADGSVEVEPLDPKEFKSDTSSAGRGSTRVGRGKRSAPRSEERGRTS